MSIVEKAVDKHRRSDKPARARIGGVVNDARSDSDNRGKAIGSAPVDVTLNHEKLSREGVTPFGDMSDKIVDEFRRLKRPLLRTAFSDADTEEEKGVARKNLVMICSALPAEGKTFTAMNLAMCIALERDRTVVLVDGDISKPHISRMLEVHNKPGLMDLLQDHSLDIGEVLLQTDMPSLKIIPAGQRHRQASELLSSQRMEAIAKELATRYSDRIILFDSSPVLQTSEAPALAALMGHLIMVVHAGQTPQRAVTDALELFAGRDVEIVLNKCRAISSSPYYGSYYGKT